MEGGDFVAVVRVGVGAAVHGLRFLLLIEFVVRIGGKGVVVFLVVVGGEGFGEFRGGGGEGAVESIVFNAVDRECGCENEEEAIYPVSATQSR